MLAAANTGPSMHGVLSAQGALQILTRNVTLGTLGHPFAVDHEL